MSPRCDNVEEEVKETERWEVLFGHFVFSPLELLIKKGALKFSRIFGENTHFKN
jgi:hypothetical protein